MFPLGTVLLPGAVLPLHVFEPRYRAMVADVLADDRTFGVALIERGPEVGGGDVRTDVGTLARVVESEQLEDGRWLLLTFGTQRFRVVEWLPDDPYPCAVVEVLTERAAGGGAAARRDDVAARLRRVLALATELGTTAVPIATELPSDPGTLAYRAAAMAGIGALDAQRVLETDDPGERLDLVAALLEDEEATLRSLLGPGGADGTGRGG